MDVSPHDLAQQLRNPEGEFGILVSEKMNESNLHSTQFAYGHLPVSDQAHILEIGFGNGRLMSMLLDEHPAVKMTGIDLSETMVAEATSYHRESINAGRMSLYQGSVAALPFEDDSFDGGCSINTLYFWPDEIACAKEICRVLKPGASLCLGVTPKKEMELLPPTQYGFSLYEDHEILSIMESAGFVHLEKHLSDGHISNFGSKDIEFHSLAFLGKKK